MDGTVLIADDDRTIRTVLAQALTRAGCRVRATGTTQTLWRWVSEGEGDAVVTDVMMPDGNGLDLLPRIKGARPELPVIVMSAQNTVVTALRAAEAGAYEYLPKPFDLREVLGTVGRALKLSARPRPVEQPEGEKLPLIGRSPAMQEVYRVMARLMNTDLPVMVTGESGTGKELVARTLHEFGHRKQKPFVRVNMGALAPDQVGPELVGTEDSEGKLDQASGGTLFLDEIGDMPAEGQTRLLRILKEGQYLRPGAAVARRADVRVMAATHQDLRARIQDGSFRDDLFYRLNVVEVRLPPLRERPGDIEDLATHFLREADESGLGLKRLSAEALERLKRLQWPGNVRELENAVKRMVVLSTDEVIGPEMVQPPAPEAPMGTPTGPAPLGTVIEAHLKRYFELHGDALPPPGLYERILKEVELPLIALALSATRGNQLRCAELLGINRNTLRKKIQDLDIKVTRGKKMM